MPDRFVSQAGAMKTINAEWGLYGRHGCVNICRVQLYNYQTHSYDVINFNCVKYDVRQIVYYVLLNSNDFQN